MRGMHNYLSIEAQYSLLMSSGVSKWNSIRLENKAHYRENSVDLSGVNLSRLFRPETEPVLYGISPMVMGLQKIDLSFAKLHGTNFSASDMTEANLRGADLSGANLEGTWLYGANLINANLSGANLRRAKLGSAILRDVNLAGADLTGAELGEAILIRTNLEQAILTNSNVYGIAAWDLEGTPKAQTGLVITRIHDTNKITVDELQLAQFVYLLLNNQSLRNVIDTVTSKAVLILGRFTEERKLILDEIHKELRQRNYLPILFDFEGPTNRNLTETVSTLAHLSKFIIADISDPRSIPQELSRIIPILTNVPVQPIIISSMREYGMFNDFNAYPWVLPIYRYDDIKQITATLNENVIQPAEAKLDQLKGK